MKIEELREIEKAMTQGIWERPKYGDGHLSVWCEGNSIADTHQRRDFSMGSTSCDANTTAIVAMANHFDALLEVAEAAKNYFTEDLDSGIDMSQKWFRWYNAVKGALKKLEAVV